jgi:hypothetical protein
MKSGHAHLIAGDFPPGSIGGWGSWPNGRAISAA